MTYKLSALLFAAAALLGHPLVAQNPMPTAPTPAAARAPVAPDLAAQLRQQIAASGMTPAQIRARLRAEGYPENFLDELLPGTTDSVEVTDDMIGAVSKIGIASGEDVRQLRAILGADSTGGRRRIEAPRVRDDSVWSRLADTLSFRLFGLETFRNQSQEFDPLLDGPVDANYRLGPGDQVVLILTGEVELTHTLDVSREGFVVVPQVGQLSVANLTLSQLESLLFSRLSRSYSGVRRGADAPTKFTVTVSRLRTIQVFVTGEVERPSSYRVSSAATAMTALYAAGGPTERGTLRQVQVRRAGRTFATLDVYDYLVRGDNARDVRLENGDIIFVGPHGPRVRVRGEVIRPATYEALDGETLTDMLAVAGGLRPTANANRVRISRIVPVAERTAPGQDRTTIDVAAVEAAFPTVKVVGGDEVLVFQVSDRVRNRITVKGHVWNPGDQGLRAGMTLGDAIRAAGGPKPDVYLGQVSVTRLRSDSTRVALRAMLLDASGGVVEDFELEEDDEVTVFSLSAFRPDRYVAIGGSVRRSGQYPWREGMTLRDLVLDAGGLLEGAYLREAEIARIPTSATARTTAVTIRIPLDSSYLGDYVPGQPYVAARGEPTAPFRSAPEVELQPYDNVLVMQQPDWVRPRSVVLSGEVRFPGRYTLLSKDERIADVIRRAGGFTVDAAPDAAFFARALQLTTFGAEADSLAEGEARDPSEAPAVERVRVGLDLPRAIRDRRVPDNLVLFHEDSLHVPLQRSTVEIRGAVNAPATLAAQGGARLGFYLRAAGGTAMNGDDRRAYVIQPNGKIQSRRSFLLVSIDPKPRPGATVVVPVRTADTRISERLALVSLFAQTATTVLTLYAILR